MNIFRWFLHHSVTNCLYFERKIEMFAQVSQQSEKMQLIHFQTQLHSSKFSKNESLSCLLTFSEDLWHYSVTNCVFLWTKMKNVCQSLTSVWKDLIYQFSHWVTQLKIFKKLTCSAVCWHFQMIFVSQDDKFFMFSDQKTKCLQKSHHSLKDSGYQFSPQSYTLKIFICQGKLTASQPIDIFKWFLHHRVFIYTLCHTKIKECAKVSK